MYKKLQLGDGCVVGDGRDSGVAVAAQEVLFCAHLSSETVLPWFPHGVSEMQCRGALISVQIWRGLNHNFLILCFF